MKRDTYVLAEVAGTQVILEPGKKVKVPKLNVEEGAKYTVDKVLYMKDGDKVEVGQPTISGMKIDTTVFAHDRDKKVIVFKKKRRKGYQKKNGHRQQFTMLEVGELKAKKAAKPKKQAAKKVEAEAAEETKE